MSTRYEFRNVSVTVMVTAVGVIEVGVVDTLTVSASQEQTVSGRGARVYTCTCVHDNIPCRRLPK